MRAIKDPMSFVSKLTGQSTTSVMYDFVMQSVTSIDFIDWFLPIEPGKPPENAFDGSNGFIKSLMPKWPPIGKHPPPIPFFFFDFDDNLRFRVWIPSFFIVNGRFTYKRKK